MEYFHSDIKWSNTVKKRYKIHFPVRHNHKELTIYCICFQISFADF